MMGKAVGKNGVLSGRAVCLHDVKTLGEDIRVMAGERGYVYGK
jgi:hypothetical protein